MITSWVRSSTSLVFVLMLLAVAPMAAAQHAGHQHTAQTKAPAPAPKVSRQSPAAEYTPTVRFRLRTELAEGKMAFVGVGGDIEGVVNPTLRVAEGDVVQVGLVNNDGIEHDVVFPDFKAATDRVNRKGASSVTVFRRRTAGEFAYFCSLPGHRQAGMEGKIVVGGGKAPVAALPPSVSIARDPADLPGPLPAGAGPHGEGRARGRRAGRQARERDDLQLLDLQRQGAGAVPARARGRHGRARR